MEDLSNILLLVGGFAIVAIASHRVSHVFRNFKLPLITGLLFTGLAAGPYIFKLLPQGSGDHLEFINEFSLAFIAFAAGTELYLKELRSSLKSIAWNTVGQLAVTFGLGSVGVYYLADHIPFMREMPVYSRVGVAIMVGSIFVARSPSSAIAIINEMRAKGPFTNISLGVTVVIDVLVIIIFTICFSLAGVFVNGTGVDLNIFLILLLELIAAFAVGMGLSYVLRFIMAYGVYDWVKVTLVLMGGFGIYFLSHYIRHLSAHHWGVEFHFEPLLACITASFTITNYTKYRPEFQKLLHNIAPYVYVAFFTLIGVSMSVDVLITVWFAALLFFGLRLVAMMVGAVAGGLLAKDPVKWLKIGWMPYVTQAGVGLGLATEVANEFPEWGQDFATVVIAVIVLNQILGPPLYKWAISYIGEDHSRAQTPTFDGVRDAVIFGLDPQSLALARQLIQNNWNTRVVTMVEDIDPKNYPDVTIVPVKEISADTMQQLEMGKVEAAVLMLKDDKNYQICELLYENYGTKDIVVRLEQRQNFDKFHALGALIVEPSTAIVSLLDHFVRSPMAASLLLGMEKDQDTVDVEVLDPKLHGVYLRNLRLPSDIIILSINRGGQMIISHGYTRLRLGDIVTIVGSKDSIDKVTLMFDKE